MDNVQQHIEKLREAINPDQAMTHTDYQQLRQRISMMAPTWHQQSIELLEQQQREIERLRIALEWYAFEIVYSPNVYKQWQPVTPVLEDGGKKARAALSSPKEEQTNCKYCGLNINREIALHNTGRPDVCDKCVIDKGGEVSRDVQDKT